MNSSVQFLCNEICALLAQNDNKIHIQEFSMVKIAVPFCQLEFRAIGPQM